jgi:hypothetical protein
MRTTVLRLLAPVALCALAPLALAADLAANLAISQVTVHRDSAIVTRSGMVELPAGEHRLVLRDLPDGIAPAGVRLGSIPPAYVWAASSCSGSRRTTS